MNITRSNLDTSDFYDYTQVLYKIREPEQSTELTLTYQTPIILKEEAYSRYNIMIYVMPVSPTQQDIESLFEIWNYIAKVKVGTDLQNVIFSNWELGIIGGPNSKTQMYMGQITLRIDLDTLSHILIPDASGKMNISLIIDNWPQDINVRFFIDGGVWINIQSPYDGEERSIKINEYNTAEAKKVAAQKAAQEAQEAEQPTEPKPIEETTEEIITTEIQVSTPKTYKYLRIFLSYFIWFGSMFGLGYIGILICKHQKRDLN